MNGSGFINPTNGDSLLLNSIVSPILVLRAKNVAVLTAGAPADLVTIAVPDWVTRWTPVRSTTTAGTASLAFIMVIQESGGLITAGQYGAFDAAGGAGLQLSSLTTNGFPGAINYIGGAAGQVSSGASQGSASRTIVLRQTANAANAGSVSFYVSIVPLI